MFCLKYHAQLSLFEQANMTGEERKWWMERIKKQKDAEQESAKGSRNTHVPSMPSRPTTP